MKKIIISLTVLLMTPLIAQADHHETSGPGEGSFTTFMVQAPDVSAYIKYLKSNPELFSGFNAAAAGVWWGAVGWGRGVGWGGWGRGHTSAADGPKGS